jgi:hypothetical protein
LLIRMTNKFGRYDTLLPQDTILDHLYSRDTF